jgi:flagellar biosynthesis/type III secretory pathway protein FliH
VIADARRRAQAIIDEACRRRDEVFDEACKEGAEAARKEATEELVRLASTQAELRETLSGQSIRLGLEIAEKILGEQVRLDPEMIASVAKRAVSQIRWCRSVTIRANPKDVETLRGARKELMAALTNVSDIEVIEDAEVSRGGCLVDTELGQIDATLDSQLAAIERALTGEAG